MAKQVKTTGRDKVKIKASEQVNNDHILFCSATIYRLSGTDKIEQLVTSVPHVIDDVIYKLKMRDFDIVEIILDIKNKWRK